MANKEIQRIKSITEFHRIRRLPKPEHPLISLVDYGQIRHSPENNRVSWIQDFYSIGLKRDVRGKFRYGQQKYDFDEGLMSFIAPGQVYSIEVRGNDIPEHHPSGWLLLIHPDFLWDTSLAKTISQYGFFNYAVNESLFLSEKEEAVIIGILQNIQQEYHSNIDKFSQGIIISHIEVLLNYTERFYERQFITRKMANHKILARLEEILDDYFKEDVFRKGLPTVQYIADELYVSPGYLSSLLKSLTGRSTRQHIHDKLIEKAKAELSTTNLSVSEIAYNLGFEHPQSFSKLFKSKTNLSPSEFRQSFN